MSTIQSVRRGQSTVIDADNKLSGVVSELYTLINQDDVSKANSIIQSVEDVRISLSEVEDAFDRVIRYLKSSERRSR